MSDDRTVHGRTIDGREIVRYDRAGKWYAENPDGARCLLTLREAASLAMAGVAHLGKPGGQRFDAIVQASVAK